MNSTSAMKILLIPKAFFGDVVLTTACISEIKRSHPSAEISVLLPPAALSLLETHQDVSEVISFDRRKEYRGFNGLRKMATLLRKRGFDKAYSFQKSPRTALLLWMSGIKQRIIGSGSLLSFLYSQVITVDEKNHEVLRTTQLIWDLLSEDQKRDWERLARCETPRDELSFQLSLPVPSRDVMSERVMEILRIDTPYVVIIPGSAWATKRWSESGFRGVVEACLKEGKRVVLTGAPNEREVCERIGADLPVAVLAGQISLHELVRLIADAAGVVCNDSMALHVASATKRPCVSIFCATSPKFGFGPWRNRAVVEEKEGLFCKPCRRHGSNRCPVGTNACIDGVTSAQVVRALWKVMDVSGSSEANVGVHL